MGFFLDKLRSMNERALAQRQEQQRQHLIAQYRDAAGKHLHVALGHDFALSPDYAAHCLALSIGEPPKDRTQTPIQIEFIDRFPLNTSYHAQAAKTRQRLQRVRHDFPEATIYYSGDASGVGIAAIEILLAQGALSDARGIVHGSFSLTNGANEMPTQGRAPWHLKISKQSLITKVAAGVNSGYVILPPPSVSPMAEIFRKELASYSFHATSKGQLGADAAKDSIHDDLVISAALAIYTLQRRGRRAGRYAMAFESEARARQQMVDDDGLQPLGQWIRIG